MYSCMAVATASGIWEPPGLSQKTARFPLYCLVQRWELAAGMVELEAGKASADKRLAENAKAQIARPAGCNYNYGQKIRIVTAKVCVSRRTSITAPNQGNAMHTIGETSWPSESTPLGWMA